MIEVSSLVALIVAEVLAGLVILSGLLVLFTLLRKGRIRKAAHHLAERVKSDKPKRLERLKTLLLDRFQYKDAELDQALHNIMQSEMLLYQNVINGFLKDDQVHLQQIDVDVENLVLNYQGLTLPEGIGSSSPANAASTGSGSEEIVILKAENERLSDELRVTMDTMGRMLNEYSSMFSGGEDSDEGLKPQIAETASTEMDTEPESVDTSPQQDQIDEQPSTEQEMVESDVINVEQAGEENTPQSDAGTEIPDMTVEELLETSYLEEESGDVEEQSSELATSTASTSMDEDAVEVDEEVSEIIDEVMGIADEMIHESEPSTTAEQSDLAGESLVDDLDKIDIEIPDVDDAVSETAEFEAGSLEEEWAKLLEEDAADETENQPEKDKE
ncbi:MAG: hypothetical protein KZQ89_07145 [Candidatus Thiodiazotropha sp. (ex Lucinoma kastoroae)]|nr:hypothetical protein [Candidatus Thiodiazotropha sp. (ex Lucinoma kastoroae)]